MLAAGHAAATPTLRAQIDQKGDFILVGNTLSHACGAPVAPVVGTLGTCGASTFDNGSDVFWRADSPAVG